MRNLILCLALGAAASSAFALTNEDLAANTWMPLEEQTESSCELPAMIDFHKDGTLFRTRLQHYVRPLQDR